jgi:hypothetical protein
MGLVPNTKLHSISFGGNSSSEFVLFLMVVRMRANPPIVGFTMPRFAVITQICLQLMLLRTLKLCRMQHGGLRMDQVVMVKLET